MWREFYRNKQNDTGQKLRQKKWKLTITSSIFIFFIDPKDRYLFKITATVPTETTTIKTQCIGWL